MARTARIELRASEAEKKSWADAAGGSRRVSEWLRSLANAACAGEKVSITMKDTVVHAPAAVLTGPQSCSRWVHHRPGVFCGSCGKVN